MVYKWFSIKVVGIRDSAIQSPGIFGCQQETRIIQKTGFGMCVFYKLDLYFQSLRNLDYFIAEPIRIKMVPWVLPWR